MINGVFKTSSNYRKKKILTILRKLDESVSSELDRTSIVMDVINHTDWLQIEVYDSFEGEDYATMAEASSIMANYILGDFTKHDPNPAPMNFGGIEGLLSQDIAGCSINHKLVCKGVLSPKQKCEAIRNNKKLRDNSTIRALLEEIDATRDKYRAAETKEQWRYGQALGTLYKQIAHASDTLIGTVSKGTVKNYGDVYQPNQSVLRYPPNCAKDIVDTMFRFFTDVRQTAREDMFSTCHDYCAFFLQAVKMCNFPSWQKDILYMLLLGLPHKQVAEYTVGKNNRPATVASVGKMKTRVFLPNLTQKMAEILEKQARMSDLGYKLAIDD